ncbi:ABC transporter ATP-binding protein/permease [Clostridioides difficile]|uniref:ABC transporter ATP-binding protein n=1 Tax=Clostridioides difficile TaxID=1496 RepID=UPI00202E6875|nr:ABC transporter ATP-binding protein [Clostridioides difficile]MCM0737570.1 ABC transporter ATP-binding protein/permease [Clostridioides difficile]MCP8331554.1 ABC transporter ATP-binding protein/permease [Clostridioides difficile]MCP8367138.1 ABC transporter ATP-binding protein/permease [Clostridioides difficile]MCP8385782.1 ABC transporter ATP-binding protein/permease [Clostridioides difficile]
MKVYIKQNKFLFLLTILTSVIASLGYVFMAILLQKLLDIAVGKNMQQFITMVLFSIFYFVMLGIFLYLQSLLSKKIICKIIKQIRSDVFKGTVSQGVEDFVKRNTADYISIISNDIKMIEDNFLLPLFEVGQYTVIFISSFVLMIYFDIIVTAFVFVAIAMMFIVPSLLGKELEKRQDILSSKLADFTAKLKDILSGFEIIKSYSMKQYVVQQFDKENSETIHSKYRVDKLFALNEGLSSFLALMVQIVVLLLSAYFIIIGRITVGTLLGMVQVSSNLANPLIMIFTNIPKIKSVQPITEKLYGISQQSLKQSHKENIYSFNHYILAKNLTFSYDKQTDVLSDVNCIIEKGKKYAIIGKSGCGKSTFIKLLAGYYSDYRGKIMYDDMELNLLEHEDVVQLSSIIHQNIYLFDETILDNICLHEKYPKEIIDKVIEESGLSEFIAGLPEGLYYRVGENGANLSGGQKQRIAVARALIRNKSILILDEGTSAVDMQTAYDIESRLLKINDLTLITITHNLKEELLKKYDEIIYMENGNIKEQAHYQELVDTSACFSEYLYLKE